MKRILIMTMLLIIPICLWSEPTPTPTPVNAPLSFKCYICDKDTVLKDIVFKAIVDVTQESIYVCYDCAAEYSIRPFGLCIIATKSNGELVKFPIVRHWIIPKEFSNENR